MRPWAAPGADLNIRENTTENQTIDRMIGTPIGTRDTAPIGELVPPASVYVPAPVHRIDKAIVDFVTNRTTPKSGSRDFAAFATIYESKMTLKRELNIQLIAKSFADLGFYAPPPISWGTVPAAYVAHIYSTSQLVLIAKEWVILDVLEKVAALPAFKKLKREVIEAQLIPMLVAHADFVASYDPQSGEFEAGILNSAVWNGQSKSFKTGTRQNWQSSLSPKISVCQSSQNQNRT